MHDYVIVTDSVLDIDERWFLENKVQWVPLSFTLEGYETLDDDFGRTIPLAQFYEYLRGGRNVTTSQGTVGRFSEVFEHNLRQGLDIIYVSFSSALSGCYDSACMARKELEQRYPEHKIRCVDTKAAAGGQTMLVREAVRCRQEGMPLDALVQHLTEIRGHILHWFTVDDLFYLHRGGRVSKSAALMGSLVGIKPVLFVNEEGQLIPYKKVRGRKKSLEELANQLQMHIEREKIERYQVCISHGDCLSDAEYLRTYLRQNMNIKDVYIHILDTVIGAHSGPGTIALFFYGDNRGS